MSRKPSVRYWNSRSAYCTTVNGKQIVLCEGAEDFPDGQCYTTALHRFGELVGGKPKGALLGDVVSAYLSWMQHHRQPDTLKINRDRLKLVCDDFARTPVCDLTAFAIEAWCDRQRGSRGWSDSTVKLTLSCINACLRWAVRSGLIAENPVKSLELPADVSRGLECVLTDEQAELVISAAKGATRDFVVCLRCTGCRPAELRRAEASNYDERLNALVYQARTKRNDKRHKTARTGKPRVLYLTGEASDIVQRLIKLHPTGPLFRTAHVKMTGADKGKRGAWTSQTVVETFGRLRRKTGIKGLCAMSFRHSYAVKWLNAGKPIHSLAAVLGTSLQMIQRHYGHHASQHDVLRRLVDL